MAIFCVRKIEHTKDDTIIIVEGIDDILKDNIGILNDVGKPYKVKTAKQIRENSTTELLVEGYFASNRIFV